MNWKKQLHLQTALKWMPSNWVFFNPSCIHGVKGIVIFLGPASFSLSENLPPSILFRGPFSAGRVVVLGSLTPCVLNCCFLALLVISLYSRSHKNSHLRWDHADNVVLFSHGDPEECYFLDHPQSSCPTPIDPGDFSQHTVEVGWLISALSLTCEHMWINSFVLWIRF